MPEERAFKLGLDAIDLSLRELVPRLGEPVAAQRKLEYALAPSLEWSVQCYLDLETLRRADRGEQDVGDVVELGAKAQEMALVIEAQGLAERDIPDYVVPDGTNKVTYTRVPKLDEVPYPVRMEPNLVIEFYSR